jgi:hypothetical protein
MLMFITLPDHLCTRLKKFAQSMKTTLTDVLRRTGVYLLAVHPQSGNNTSVWQPPAPHDLGEFKVAEAEWRTHANELEGSSKPAER